MPMGSPGVGCRDPGFMQRGRFRESVPGGVPGEIPVTCHSDSRSLPIGPRSEGDSRSRRRPVRAPRYRNHDSATSTVPSSARCVFDPPGIIRDMADPAGRRATYDDLLRAPPNKVAEILGGELVLSPRPAGPHTAAATALGEELGPPFKRGRGGPGGWIILDEPELHLLDDVAVPDLGGWRRSTMAAVPNEPYFTVRPDWVCEVLSPSTERYDRGDKVPLYARAGTAHAWLVNPLQRTLEVLRLSSETPRQWLTLGVFRDDAKVRAEPFEAFELDLAVLWQDVEL